MRKGAYLLPSSLTLVNLGLGFFSIIQSINGNYFPAAVAIVWGHVADVIDGIVARMTHTTSTFGLEFDSFADWITFGIAPSILMYQITLNGYGKVGFGIALFFVICGSLRLAKFNIKAHEGNAGDGNFTGLPIPAAGGILAAIVLIYDLSTRTIMSKTIPFVMIMVPFLMKGMPIIMFILSIMMVSRMKFFSTKKQKFFRPTSLRAVVFWVVGGLLIYAYPQNFTFILYVTYICSGLFGYVLRTYRLRRKKNEAV
ncbi:MAG: CDP-diacylglycerol--serine O-phosphatidyltransferase [bacterium]